MFRSTRDASALDPETDFGASGSKWISGKGWIESLPSFALMTHRSSALGPDSFGQGRKAKKVHGISFVMMDKVRRRKLILLFELQRLIEVVKSAPFLVILQY